MRDASRRGFTDSVRPARLLGQSEPYLFFLFIQILPAEFLPLFVSFYPKSILCTPLSLQPNQQLSNQPSFLTSNTGDCFASVTI